MNIDEARIAHAIAATAHPSSPAADPANGTPELWASMFTDVDADKFTAAVAHCLLNVRRFPNPADINAAMAELDKSNPLGTAIAELTAAQAAERWGGHVGLDGTWHSRRVADTVDLCHICADIFDAEVLAEEHLGRPIDRRTVISPAAGLKVADAAHRRAYGRPLPDDLRRRLTNITRNDTRKAPQT